MTVITYFLQEDLQSFSVIAIYRNKISYDVPLWYLVQFLLSLNWIIFVRRVKVVVVAIYKRQVYNHVCCGIQVH